MRTITCVRSFFSSLARKSELDADTAAELESVLDMMTEEGTRAGLSPGEARRQARIQLGGVEQVTTLVRQRRVGASIDELLQDVHWALRSIRRNRALNIAVIAILGVGIGATSALFAALDATLLRPLPYRSPDRLVFGEKTVQGRPSRPVSRVDYYDYRDHCGCFDVLAATSCFSSETAVLGGTRPELARMAFATWNLFPALGVSPVLGRGFLAEDETPGSSPVVMLSHAYWQRRFGGDPGAVGASLDTGSESATIVGVLPEAFRFLHDADIWALITRDGPFDLARDAHSTHVVGLLRSGVSLRQAQDEADQLSATLARRFPDTNEGKGLLLHPLRPLLTAQATPSLTVLSVATLLLLLVSCTNAAGLLLSRGQGRMTEMAVRSSLGASRWRLMRQLLVEGVVVGGLAGVAGLAIALICGRALHRLLPEPVPGVPPPAMDEGVLLFAMGVSLVCGLAVGLVPALRSASSAPSQQLRSGRGVAESRHSATTRAVLVVAQVAVSLVLLVSAGMLVRSLLALASVEPGFEQASLAHWRIQIPRERYRTPEERDAFFTSLLTRIRALPAVRSAALTSKLPLLDRTTDWDVWPADQPRPTGAAKLTALARWVTPGYFDTMGMTLLRGRDLEEIDRPGSRPVVVISERVAELLFPQRDPLGLEVRILGSDEPVEIVGVVADARIDDLSRPPYPSMYISSAQFDASRMRLVVRYEGDPGALFPEVRDLVESADPDVLLAEPGTMAAVVEQVLGEPRVLASSLGVFTAVAVALAAVGLYGLLAFHVVQRKREIAIRLALGARPRSIAAAVLARAAGLAALGVIAGGVLSVPAVRLLQPVLVPGTTATPLAHAAALSVLALLTLGASALPALQSCRTDPNQALRTE